MAVVTDDEGRADLDWFYRHRTRFYRARIVGDRICLVRRRGKIARHSVPVMSRTFAASLAEQLPDTDAALREAWFSAAWSALAPDELKALIKRARERERR